MDPLEPKPRLQDQFRRVMRANHYSLRTEKSYWYWIRFYLRFHKMRHPREMSAREVNQFLSWLATDRQVAAGTQNLALNALVFLYTRVLEQPLGDIGETIRAKKSRHLPVVMSHQEAMMVINHLHGPYKLLASLMYGAGPRVVEAARLRVKDIDFSTQIITVRDGKGAKDRTTLLPTSLATQLASRIELIRTRMQEGDSFFQVPVSLPFALKRKYPHASTSVHWQWLFPSTGICLDQDRDTVRHHVHVSTIQRAVKKAIGQSGFNKPASCHTFRHSFATELLKRGSDIRTV